MSVGIAVEDVTVSLAGKRVLQSITWTLEPGRHWAVLGPNGAGKSTFLRLLRGDVRPEQTSSGESKGRCLWIIDGKTDASPLAIKPVARTISAEQHRLYVRKEWNFSGLELIVSAFSDSLLPSPPEPGQIETATAVAESLGAAYLLKRQINAMSQGQFRLVLLARAMASSPKLLLFDEPFDGLDNTTRGVLHAALDKAAQTATLIVSAHRDADVPSCVTHILRLRNGKAESSAVEARSTGTPSRPAPLRSPAPFARASRNPAEARPDDDSEYALRLQNVAVYVDREKVLHDLDWDVRLGESWRISGVNGSGKSTLLRLVAGLEHAALGGTLHWFGAERPPLETRLRETGYVSDSLHATYMYDVTGLELVLSGFDGSVGIWRKFTKKERDEAFRRLEFLGLSAMAHTPMSRLSSGTARRFFLARALVGPVRLLLLDEPCSGLDAPSREQFIAAVDAVLASGVQCLYVSHHDEDLPAGVARELRLDQGKIVEIK